MKAIYRRTFGARVNVGQGEISHLLMNFPSGAADHGPLSISLVVESHGALVQSVDLRGFGDDAVLAGCQILAVLSDRKTSGNVGEIEEEGGAKREARFGLVDDGRFVGDFSVFGRKKEGELALHASLANKLR